MIRLLDIAVASTLAGSVLFVWWHTLTAMSSQWSASPMYSYAYTVPFISLYILWWRRDEFRRRRLEPARVLALPVLGLAFVLFFLGEVGAIQLLQQFALLVAIAGIVLFLFGVEYFKIAAPALGYLLFMIPFWDVFTEPLHWPFQQSSARLGVGLLHAIGIPALRESTVITLPNVTIEVARACSGVNYLVAVLALALPMSYLRLSGLRRRVVLISSAMVIAALANGLRVALIGALAYFEVGSPLHGPFHVLHGLFVAAIGYVALFGGLRLLETGNENQATAREIPRAQRSRWRLLDASALAVAFWTMAIVGVAPAHVPVALAHPLDELPHRLGTWTRQIGPVTPPVGADAWSNAHEQVRWRYRSIEGQNATVDIWYYEEQEQSREIVNFKAADLHRQARPWSVSLPDGSTLNANLVHWPAREEVGLFWYDLDGAVEAGQNAAKLRSLWNVIRAGRSNGAAIMLRAPVSGGSSDRAIAALQALAIELHTTLGKLWTSGRGRVTGVPSASR